MSKSSTFSGSLREYYATFVINHAGILIGLVFLYPASLIPGLKSDGYSVDTLIESFLGSIPSIANLVTAPFIMSLMGKAGRKRIIQICLVITAASFSIIVFFPSEYVICFCLAISSAAVGFLIPTTTAYVTEVSKKELRGTLLATTFICLSSGAPVIYILNLFLRWRAIAGVLVLVALSGLVQSLFIPESQYWLLIINKFDIAKKSMMWFQPNLSTTDLDEKIKSMEQSLQSDKASTGYFSKLIQFLTDRKVLKPLFIGLILNIIRSGDGTMIIGIFFYDFLQRLHIPYDLEKWMALYGAVFLVSNIGIVAVTRLLNRKTALYLWSVLMGIFLMIVIIYKCLCNLGVIIPPWIPMISMYTYFLVSMAGLYSVMSVIITEIQAAYCRPEMNALLNSIISIFYAIYAFLYPYVVNEVPIEYILLFFWVNLVLVPILVYVMVPETSSLEFYDNMTKKKVDQH